MVEEHAGFREKLARLRGLLRHGRESERCAGFAYRIGFSVEDCTCAAVRVGGRVEVPQCDRHVPETHSCQRVPETVAQLGVDMDGLCELRPGLVEPPCLHRDRSDDQAAVGLTEAIAGGNAPSKSLVEHHSRGLGQSAMAGHLGEAAEGVNCSVLAPGGAVTADGVAVVVLRCPEIARGGFDVAEGRTWGREIESSRPEMPRDEFNGMRTTPALDGSWFSSRLMPLSAHTSPTARRQYLWLLGSASLTPYSIREGLAAVAPRAIALPQCRLLRVASRDGRRLNG